MPRSVASSSDGDSTSDDFSDWQSSLHGALRTLSLFSSHPAPNQAPTSTEAGGSGALEDSEVWLDTPLEAVEYDARVYNWDLKKVVQDLDLDDYQRIKLINWIRKHNPSPTDETLLTIIKDKDHPLFTSHEDPANEEQQREEGEEDWNSYLRPTFEGDGLLQLSFDDDSWSSDGEEVAQAHVAMGRVRLDTEPALASTSAARSTTGIGSSTEDTILRLTSELAQSQAQVQKFKSMLQTAVEDEDTDSSDGCTSNSSSSNESEDETEKTVSMGASRSRSKGKSVVHGKGKGKEQKKDIDTYYFDSYAANGEFPFSFPVFSASHPCLPGRNAYSGGVSSFHALTSSWNRHPRVDVERHDPNCSIWSIHSLASRGLEGRHRHGCWVRNRYPFQ